MEQLIQKIEAAGDLKELEAIVNAIPHNEHGGKSKLARILDDAFWYLDFTDERIDYVKYWMTVRVESYYPR